MTADNPNVAPDPEAWNSLDETERVLIVERYHKTKHIHMPNQTAHETFHVIVANHIVMGDELNAAHTLNRLMAEGLDRHAAVHALGSVLAEHLHRKDLRGMCEEFNESQ